MSFLFPGFNLFDIRESDGTEVFTETKAMSPYCERPILIIPGKETKERFDLVMGVLGASVECLEQSPLTVEHNGENVLVQVVPKLSQLDGKALKCALGLGGCFCCNCSVHHAEAVDPVRISRGFAIDRSISQLHELFDEISFYNDDGELVVPRGNGDYSTRKGLTFKPSVHVELTRNLPITHALLRSLKFWEDTIQRINAKVFKGGLGVRYTPEEKESLRLAKVDMREKARILLKMKLDQPDSTGHGGSSDTAACAQKFFSEDNKDGVMGLFNDHSMRTNVRFQDLHYRFSVTLRVLSSKRKVNTEQFGHFCIDTYLLLVSLLPWLKTIPG